MKIVSVSVLKIVISSASIGSAALYVYRKKEFEEWQKIRLSSKRIILPKVQGDTRDMGSILGWEDSLA